MTSTTVVGVPTGKSPTLFLASLWIATEKQSVDMAALRKGWNGDPVPASMAGPQSAFIVSAKGVHSSPSPNQREDDCERSEVLESVDAAEQAVAADAVAAGKLE
jgi:hypothetical protein